MGRVSRNNGRIQTGSYTNQVTSRMGRVSRNLNNPDMAIKAFTVTSRMGRVSRNFKEIYGGQGYYVSRPAWGV